MLGDLSRECLVVLCEAARGVLPQLAGRAKRWALAEAGHDRIVCRGSLDASAAVAVESRHDANALAAQLMDLRGVHGSCGEVVTCFWLSPVEGGEYMHATLGEKAPHACGSVGHHAPFMLL